MLLIADTDERRTASNTTESARAPGGKAGHGNYSDLPLLYRSSRVLKTKGVIVDRLAVFSQQQSCGGRAIQHGRRRGGFDPATSLKPYHIDMDLPTFREAI